jgi:site-specific DNA-methyltransferase (cytosine-N4-specific)
MELFPDLDEQSQRAADPNNRNGEIIAGDARIELANMESASVQCCVTSPPYWGLRDYGIEGQIGAEMNLDDYIFDLVAIFAEVR